MMPVLGVPKDIINKAAANPGGEEAKSLYVLEQNLANLHAGEQAYIMLPSDPFDNTQVKEYSIEFKGISGSGKQFDTGKLIERRTKAIYNRLGAGFLITGDSGSGSYALSDNKQTFHSHTIERDIDITLEVLNKELVPQLLALNGIYLEDKDMPKIKAGTVGDPDVEANSKMIQRVVSVGAVPMVPEVINEFLEKLGLSYRLPVDIISDEKAYQDFVSKYLPANVSRAGDGMSKPGNGTSNSVASTDNSSLNLDNAS
jgi:hypothetical protein